MSSMLPRPNDPAQPPRETFRDRWHNEVWTTPDIPDGCRVLLLALVPYMDAKGYVSVPRDVLAERIGRPARRVAERTDQALAANYLARVKRGQKGVTAVYRAMLPEAYGATSPTPQDAANPHAENAPITTKFQHADGPFSMSPGGHASSSPTGASRSRRASAVEHFTSREIISEVETTPAEPQAAPRPRLLAVVPQTCRHDDPHPELCALCEGERNRAKSLRAWSA